MCGGELEVTKTKSELGGSAERKEIRRLLTGLVAGPAVGPTGSRTGTIGREIGSRGAGFAVLGTGPGTIGRGA